MSDASDEVTTRRALRAVNVARAELGLPALTEIDPEMVAALDLTCDEPVRILTREEAMHDHPSNRGGRDR